MWIVKLGGSLETSPLLLRAWLDCIAERGIGKAVIVPGGGRFADAVRAAQNDWAIDDAIAHAMAIHAMAQYAYLVSGLHPLIQPADSAAAIQTVWRERKTPVWLPVPMALSDPDIEASWRITSDSLALWLAARLGLKRVALIKSAAPSVSERASVDRLVQAGLVDELFAHYARRSACEIYYLGPTDYVQFGQALRDGTNPGKAIPY